MTMGSGNAREDIKRETTSWRERLGGGGGEKWATFYDGEKVWSSMIYIVYIKYYIAVVYTVEVYL